MIIEGFSLVPSARQLHLMKWKALSLFSTVRCSASMMTGFFRNFGISIEFLFAFEFMTVRARMLHAKHLGNDFLQGLGGFGMSDGNAVGRKRRSRRRKLNFVKNVAC